MTQECQTGPDPDSATHDAPPFCVPGHSTQNYLEERHEPIKKLRNPGPETSNAMTKPPKGRRVVASAVGAATLTAVAAGGMYWLVHRIVPRWVGEVAAIPAAPAFYVSFVVPIGHGQLDAGPSPQPPLLLVLTFAFWWAVLYWVLGRYGRESD